MTLCRLLGVLMLVMLTAVSAIDPIVIRGNIVLTAPAGEGCTMLNRTVDIGVPFSGSGALLNYSQSGLVVAQMFIDGVNRQCGSGGLGFAVRIIGCDMASDPARIPGCVEHLSNCTAMMMPEGGMAGIAAKLANSLGIPLVAGMSGVTSVFTNSQGKRIHKNLFGVMTPAARYMHQCAVIARNQKYRTASIVTLNSTATDASYDITTGAIRSLSDNKISLLDRIIIDIDSTTPPDVKTAKIADALARAKANNPDFIITGFGTHCESLLLAVQRADINPQEHCTVECLNMIQKLPHLMSVAQYMINPVQWDVSLTGREYEDAEPSVQPFANLFPPTVNQSSPQRFVEAYMRTSIALTGGIVPLQATAVAQMAGFYRIDQGVVVSEGDLSGLALVRAMQSMNTNSFFGQISTDRTGQNGNRPMPLLQLVDVVGGYLIIPEINLPILPMPTFEERIFAPVYLSTVTERAFLATASLLTIVILLCAAIVIRYRHNTAIKMQSVPFSMIFLVGCLDLTWAPSTWLPVSDDVQCILRFAIWSLAFIMLVGPITATAYRIYDISGLGRSGTIQVRRITNTQLFLRMLLLMSPMIVLFTLSLAMSDMELVQISVDPIRPVHDYLTCQSTHGRVTAIALAGAAAAALALAFTCYYAWHIRKLDGTLADFNNATKLAVLTLFTVFSIVFGGAIEFGVAENESNRVMRFAFLIALTHVYVLFALLMYFFDPFYVALGKTKVHIYLNQTRLNNDSSVNPPTGGSVA
jgi:hypothetical protein